jgi:hypothetical protein
MSMQWSVSNRSRADSRYLSEAESRGLPSETSLQCRKFFGARFMGLRYRCRDSSGHHAATLVWPIEGPEFGR